MIFYGLASNYYIYKKKVQKPVPRCRMAACVSILEVYTQDSVKASPSKHTLRLTTSALALGNIN